MPEEEESIPKALVRRAASSSATGSKVASVDGGDDMVSRTKWW